MEKGGEYQISKVVNPELLSALNSEVIKFAEKMDLDGVTSQSLWLYFYESIQRSVIQENSGMPITEEFWVVYTIDDDTTGTIAIHAFSHWFKQGLPHVGSVYCDFMYSWNTAKKPASMLINKFVEFGKRHHCPWYEFDAVNERVYTVFKKAAEKRGYEIKRRPRVNCIGREKNGR